MVNRVEGNIVDVHNREVFKGCVEVENGKITAIMRKPTNEEKYIMPGFIDGHVHVESSMLTPENFGRMAVRQGTVAVVSDSHEIANVLGIAGLDFMHENSLSSPIKTFFTIPSCVPATSHQVSGHVISSAEVEHLAASGRYVGLSEMMNVPGVLSDDKEMKGKLDIARKYNMPVDGHAPLLEGDDLVQYVNAGISTDHECVSPEEAHQKIGLGMTIQIREGSAARNFEALKSLIATHPDDAMFCTDDSHPSEIMEGHIRKMVLRSLQHGFDLFDVLKVASLNAINHYKLDVGQLRVGDKADFIVVDNLSDLNIDQVYIDGIAQIGRVMESEKLVPLNNFNHDRIDAASLRKAVSKPIKVILLIKDELLTRVGKYAPLHETDNLESDLDCDIAKIVYINRYTNGVPQVAYCTGFGLKKGAFATSVSHDAHNIIAVGMSDEELVNAINAVIDCRGGLSACYENNSEVLPLPIAGIMSDRSGEEVDEMYEKVNQFTKKMGCTLNSPFMTLSFLSLVVIPELKIGEHGLFSYKDFDWTSLEY